MKFISGDKSGKDKTMVAAAVFVVEPGHKTPLATHLFATDREVGRWTAGCEVRGLADPDWFSRNRRSSD
jgi:hypothetical protein